jgi:hypothetical protein
MWFEFFHLANGWPKCEFSTELLFSDRYLLQILSIGIPSDFDPIDEDDLIIPQA